jgi:hypothetical protein
MVGSLVAASRSAVSDAGTQLLATTERAKPLLLRLEPDERARVVLALVALVMVGALLVVIAWLGGRHVRRLARRPLLPSPRNPDARNPEHALPQGPPRPEAHE